MRKELVNSVPLSPPLTEKLESTWLLIDMALVLPTTYFTDEETGSELSSSLGHMPLKWLSWGLNLDSHGSVTISSPP